MKRGLRTDDRERGGCRARSCPHSPSGRRARAEAQRVDDVRLPGQGVPRSRSRATTGAEHLEASRSPENGESGRRPRQSPRPAADKSGAILLIDASNSMKGAPIKNAMAAPRARSSPSAKKDLARRRSSSSAPTTACSADFTTEQRRSHAGRRQDARRRPRGTHLRRARQRRRTRRRTRGSSGRRSSSSRTAPTSAATRPRAEALQAATDANVRVISVGLELAAVRPGDAQEPRRTGQGGTYVETATPAELQPIFQEIGPAALERVRGHVPLAAPATAEGGRGWSRSPASRPPRRRTRHPRSTSRPQGTFEHELDRRRHHVAVAA